MIISVDAGKFPKIRHPSMIKLQNMDIEGNILLNMTKTTYDKPTANLILSGAKLKAYPLRSGTRQEGPLLPLLLNLVLGVLATAISERKRKKGTPKWKRSKTQFSG